MYSIVEMSQEGPWLFKFRNNISANTEGQIKKKIKGGGHCFNQ